VTAPKTVAELVLAEADREARLRRQADAYGCADPEALVAEARRYANERGVAYLAALDHIGCELARQWAEP